MTDRKNPSEDPYRYEAQRAPETVDWKRTIADCLGDKQRFKQTNAIRNVPQDEVSARHALRFEVIKLLAERRNMSRSDSEDVVDHAIRLYLIEVTADGQFVYLPTDCQRTLYE